MKRKIRDVLRTKGEMVHSVTRDTSVLRAVDLMNHHHIGSVLVMDDTKLAGIFTERDVLVRVVAAGRDPAELTVGEVMTIDLNTLGPDAMVAEAMKMMTERRCRHVPIVEDGKLLGLLSIGDAMKALSMGLEEDVHTLESYIGGPYLA